MKPPSSYQLPSFFYREQTRAVHPCITETGTCRSGITGEGHSLTERDLWVQKEKEFLAAIILEQGIEWEQKGEHKEHLSVLEFKREKRKEELAELEQTIEHVQQQQVSIKVVE